MDPAVPLIPEPTGQAEMINVAVGDQDRVDVLQRHAGFVQAMKKGRARLVGLEAHVDQHAGVPPDQPDVDGPDGEGGGKFDPCNGGHQSVYIPSIVSR